MNSKLIRTFLIAIIATMSLTFTSCEPDDPITTPLLGTWELKYIDDATIRPSEIDKLYFAPNATGTYAYYNKAGRWIQDPFTWRSWGNSLYITFDSDLEEYSMSFRIARDNALEIYNSTLFSGQHVYYRVARTSK